MQGGLFAFGDARRFPRSSWKAHLDARTINFVRGGSNGGANRNSFVPVINYKSLVVLIRIGLDGDQSHSIESKLRNERSRHGGCHLP
jgi:hypothetical protein